MNPAIPQPMPSTSCGHRHRHDLQREPCRRQRLRLRLRQQQRGLGTLSMCVVLLTVLGLGATWAARQLASAQRVAANDLRGAAAAEAAEAGIAWTIAMLNTGRVDDRCRPAVDASGEPNLSAIATERVPGDFRQRFLQVAADGYFRPRSGSAPATAGTSSGASTNPGTATANGERTPDWLASCVNTGALRWLCRCGGESGYAIGGSDLSAAQPMFSIRFADGGTGGLLRLLVRACSALSRDCDDLSDSPRGVAEISQQLALLSALRRPPQVSTLEGPGTFNQLFGMPPARYRSQPAVTRLRCDVDCGPLLAQALARGRRLFWIDGDARISSLPASAAVGPPLVLIATGRLELSTSGSLRGLLYARDGVRWHPPTGTAASLRGALASDGVIDRAAQVTVTHDADVLQEISRRMGSYLPVPGGWTPTR